MRLFVPRDSYQKMQSEDFRASADDLWQGFAAQVQPRIDAEQFRNDAAQMWQNFQQSIAQPAAEAGTQAGSDIAQWAKQAWDSTMGKAGDIAGSAGEAIGGAAEQLAESDLAEPGGVQRAVVQSAGDVMGGIGEMAKESGRASLVGQMVAPYSDEEALAMGQEQLYQPYVEMQRQIAEQAGEPWGPEQEAKAARQAVVSTGIAMAGTGGIGKMPKGTPKPAAVEPAAAPSVGQGAKETGIFGKLADLMAGTQAKQDQFLAERGMTMDQARALSPAEKASLDKEWEAFNARTPAAVEPAAAAPPAEPPRPPTAVGAGGPELSGEGVSATSEGVSATSAARSTAQPPALPGETVASPETPPSRISPQAVGESPPSSGAPPNAASIAGQGDSGYVPQGPPKEAGFREFWDRTRNVIAAQGPAGTELAQKLHQSREFAERTAGGWVSAMPTVRSLSRPEFEKFVDMAEGLITSPDPVLTRALGEWSAVRDQVWNAATKAGIKVGKQQDYFPHIFEPGTFSDKHNFEKAVQHLVSSGQAKNVKEAEQLMYRFKAVAHGKHGNLEQSRIADLPGYKRDKEALFGYVESAADRIGQAFMFGPQYEKSAQLLSKIRKSGYDDSAAKHAFNVATGGQLYGEKARQLSRVARAYNVVTKMGLSLIANATQSINTATVGGTMRTLRNLPDAFGDQQAADYALRIGVTLDGVINDLREGAGFSGKFAKKVGAPGFKAVERFNRTLAAAVGKEFALDEAAKAAAGDTAAIRRLAEMGLDGQAVVARGGVLTQGQIDTAARRIVERTQFKVDPQDLPVWADSPLGKAIMQFRTFSYNQSAFMAREVIGPALKGDVGPMIRFLLLASTAGTASTELRNLIANRPSEEDSTKRIIQYFQRVGGIGIVGDLMTAFFPQNVKYLDPNRYTTMAIGAMGGPTVGTVSDVLGGAAGAWQGKPTNLERFGLRQVPVVGSTLQNTFLPYKPGGRAGESPEGTSLKSIFEKRRGTSTMREFLRSRSR